MPSNPRPRKRVRSWNQLQLSIFALLIAGTLTFMIGTLLFLYITLDLPDVSSLDAYSPAQTTLIYDDKGEVVQRIFRENRIVVALDQLPELLPAAFISAEDARFYEHAGVDGWSIIRALITNLRAGEKRQGGSTITQQVARALLLSREKTYSRKIREAILAYRIDRRLSKSDILHIYLNQIYLGSGAYGVETAAWNYFGKSAGKLSLAEFSLLAGLPQAPSRYSPFRDYTAAKRRQAYVLNRMAEEGYITPTAARRAYIHPLLWSSPERDNPENGYFLQQVKNQVEQRYGDKLLLEGGLRIHTTLDQKLQQQAAQAVTHGIALWERRQSRIAKEHGAPQAALIAIETESGMVRAVTGGTDFGQTQFNRAVQARRQPGSAFKPLVYIAALERGMTPATVVIDEAVTFPGAKSGNDWKPQNFDNRYHGPTTLRDGLVFSRNIVAIKLLEETGVKPVINLARRLGISTPLANNLSLALGSSEVTVMELTAAYAAFANGGIHHNPIFIKSIRDHRGRLLESTHPRGRRVLDPRTAYQITRLLEGVIKEGTGRSVADLGVPAAGKTGTTDRYQDAWFIGYTPELVTGVWMGFDRQTLLGRNESGGRAATPIWLHFMRNAVKRLAGKGFPRPEGIVLAPINNTISDGVEGEKGEEEESAPPRISWEAFRTDNLPPQLLTPLEGQEPLPDKLKEMPAEG